MMVCPNCGTPLESGSCTKCGPVAAERQPGPAIADNIASAMCYLLLLVTGVLFLTLAPYNHNRKVRFHALQAIFVNVVIVILWVGLSLLGKGLALLISPVFMLFSLILWLLLIWTAWQDERIVLPLIGPMAEKRA